MKIMTIKIMPCLEIMECPQPITVVFAALMRTSHRFFLEQTTEGQVYKANVKMSFITGDSLVYYNFQVTEIKNPQEIWCLRIYLEDYSVVYSIEWLEWNEDFEQSYC